MMRCRIAWVGRLRSIVSHFRFNLTDWTLFSSFRVFVSRIVVSYSRRFKIRLIPRLNRLILMAILEVLTKTTIRYPLLLLTLVYHVRFYKHWDLWILLICCYRTVFYIPLSHFLMPFLDLICFVFVFDFFNFLIKVFNLIFHKLIVTFQMYNDIITHMVNIWELV